MQWLLTHSIFSTNAIRTADEHTAWNNIYSLSHQLKRNCTFSIYLCIYYIFCMYINFLFLCSLSSSISRSYFLRAFVRWIACGLNTKLGCSDKYKISNYISICGTFTLTTQAFYSIFFYPIAYDRRTVYTDE